MKVRPLLTSCGLLLLLPAAGRTDKAEDRFVKRVEELGGTVILKRNERIFITRDEKALMRELLREQPVVGVEFTGSRITDLALKELPALDQVRTLRLVDTQVTDAGLKALARLPQLQELVPHRSNSIA